MESYGLCPNLAREQCTCIVNTRVINGEEAGQVHQTHAKESRTLPTVRWQKTLARLLLGLYLILLLNVQSASAFDSEYSCAAGQRHRHFQGCMCEEFALIIEESEVLVWRSLEIMVYTRTHGKRKKTQYYICNVCIKCGDGIKIDEQCTRLADTVCSMNACADPTWVFDFGSKSCKPAPTRAPTTTTTTTRRVPTTRWIPTPRPPHSRIADDPDRQDNDGQAGTGTSPWLLRHIQDIIIGLMAGVAMLVICIIIMMIMIIQMNLRLRKISTSGTPYSSQNTSKSSIVNL